MRSSSGVVDATASFGAATSRRENSAADNRGNILPQAEWFGLMARDIWKFKAAAHVQCHTGYSDRTCRSWTAADSEPPARVLALLLRSADGAVVLAWVMGDDPPEWYGALQRVHTALAAVFACK